MAYVEFALPFSRKKRVSGKHKAKSCYTCSELATDVLLRYASPIETASLRSKVRANNRYKMPYCTDRESSASISPGALVETLLQLNTVETMGEPAVTAAINAAQGLPWDAHLQALAVQNTLKDETVVKL